jgi:LmbE family N-acetylglucosaminyl deacetylase
MVMSGTGERVVFVLDAPGDESLLAGGTIARLLDDGASATVYFGSTDAASANAATVALARTALGETDPGQWRALTGDSDAVGRREMLRAALGEAEATAVVIAAVDPVLRQAAVAAAADHGAPVFVSSRVTDAAGQRLTAIDVSDQVERKLAALAAYGNRWRVDGHTVHPVGGGELPVTGSETYLRSSAPILPADAEETPTPATRLITALMALAAGVLFAVLGTVAHQTTVAVGSVSVPVGLVLSLIAACTLLVGLRLVVRDRLVVLAAAIGLLGTIFLLSLRSTGGSVLVPQGVPGTVWTMAPALVAAVVIAWPRIPARRPTA